MGQLNGERDEIVPAPAHDLAIAREPSISLDRCSLHAQPEEEHPMALYSTTGNVPRDPSAINQHFNLASFVTGILVLTVLAAAIALYFFVVTEPSLQPTANAPPSMELGRPASAPQPQPNP